MLLQVSPSTFLAFAAVALIVGGGLLWATVLIGSALWRWKPPVGIGFGFLVTIALGWGAYRLAVPSRAVYEQEFRGATGITLPASARLVDGCSDWATTSGVYELNPTDWRTLTDALRSRSEREGRPLQMLCPLRDSPAFWEAEESWAMARVQSEGLLWSADPTRHRIAWELWWH